MIRRSFLKALAGIVAAPAAVKAYVSAPSAPQYAPAQGGRYAPVAPMIPAGQTYRYVRADRSYEPGDFFREDGKIVGIAIGFLSVGNYGWIQQREI